LGRFCLKQKTARKVETWNLFTEDGTLPPTHKTSPTRKKKFWFPKFWNLEMCNQA
jgi:hypothetical protein